MATIAVGDIHGNLSALNDVLDDKTPLEAVVESEQRDPLGHRQTIRFAAAYGGERMFAYLFLPPQSRPPYQTVVLFPGSMAIHAATVGQAELRRIDFMLKGGRAVMLPVYKGTFQRDDLKSDYPEETAFYKDHVIMWVKDLARSIDYLETRDDIDADRIAYYGLSWGGAMGAILPAVERRFKAVVLYVAGLNFQRALPEVDQINYVTRVTQPTLMLNGELDFYFSVRDVAAADVRAPRHVPRAQEAAYVSARTLGAARRDDQGDTGLAGPLSGWGRLTCPGDFARAPRAFESA